MGIIQKRADELKPGDVWCYTMPSVPRVYAPGEPKDPPIEQRLVVLRDARTSTALGSQRPYVVAVLDGIGSLEQMVSLRTFNPEQLLDVEAPDLTPAQQHTEELATLLRSCAGLLSDNSLAARDAFALLDKIKPPEPPTLAEALAELDSLRSHAKSCGAFEKCGAVMERSADALLDRARRANLLK